MLVLTRKAGEQIVIDGNIVVTVSAVEGNKVRIGIEAPMSVSVDRAEVHQRRLEEQSGKRQPRPKREAVLVGS